MCGRWEREEGRAVGVRGAVGFAGGGEAGEAEGRGGGGGGEKDTKAKVERDYQR